MKGIPYYTVYLVSCCTVYYDISLHPEEKRAANGKGNRNSESKNRYRLFYSAKEIKVRSDMIKTQLFCHNSPFGGRVDTSKLSKHPVIVEQPSVGFEN
jgi:hypothetical protein